MTESHLTTGDPVVVNVNRKNVTAKINLAKHPQGNIADDRYAAVLSMSSGRATL
jgi:hypothetical protein